MPEVTASPLHTGTPRPAVDDGYGAPALSMRRWVFPIFLVCTLLLLLPVALSIWSILARGRSFEQVQHTKDVQLQAVSLLSLLQDAETAQRGFLLTADDTYLAPYDHAEERLRTALTALQALTADNAEHQARLARLVPMVESKLEELRSTITLRRDQGLEAALAVVRTDAGKQAMDQIRMLLREIDATENMLLARRLAALSRYSNMLAGGMATAVALILASAGVAAFKVNQEMRAREEAMRNLNQIAVHLREANDALATVNGELQHFAYVASHDLQEPLRSISGYVQLLARRYGDALDEKAQGYIEKSVAATKRMQLLIENLLAYSRIANAAQVFDRVDTSAVVSDALVDLEHRIRTANATVHRDTLPPIEGDRTQITQLFRNLLGNALKFRGEKPPSIRITATPHWEGAEPTRDPRKSNMWRFSVIDNGIGFDAEHADRIFLMFQRLHTRQEFSGTGIGLALCKKIVERHGGRIWAEAETGEGATFHFTLPAARE